MKIEKITEKERGFCFAKGDVLLGLTHSTIIINVGQKELRINLGKNKIRHSGFIDAYYCGPSWPLYRIERE